MKKIVLALSLLVFVASACSVRDEMARMDERMDSLESTTSELVKKEVEGQVQQANKAIAQVRRANDSLKLYVSVFEGGLSALSDKELEDYKTLDANLDAIDVKTAALSRSIEELQAYVDEKSTEEQKWMDAISITLDKLYEIKSEVAGIQTDITDIRSQISDLGDRCDGLQDGIDQANTDIATLNTDLTALAAKEAQDVQTINSSISDLSSTVSNLSTTVTNNYNELKGCIDDINGDITDLYGQISSLDDKIGAETSAREAAISAINDRISTINGQIETINSGISALTARVETNENSISALDALTQTMHATLNDCCTNITNLTDRMNAVEGRMTTAETDIDTLYNRTERLSQKIENIVSTVQSMTLVPDCSDGSVEVVNGQNVLYFDVRPTSIAKTLAQDVQETVFTMTGYSAKTKSSIGDPVDLPVDAVNYNESKRLLEVTVNTSNLGDNFFNGNEGANAVLAVKSGKIDKSSEYFPLFAYVHVQSVSLPSSMSFNVNDIYQFVPTFNPPKATNQNVVWSIHDASDPTKKTVAQISSAGLMNALKEGTSTVSVESEDGKKKASCTVTIMTTGVVAVTGISLDKTSMPREIGDASEAITATITPDNATNKNVLWSTSNAAVATVSNGVVSFVGGGEAVITARAQADPSISATCVVTVKVPVTGVQFDPDDITIPVGQSQVLSYKLMPENATNKNVTLSVHSGGSYISLNTSTGEVTANAAGTATVKIATKEGGFTDYCTIHCTQAPTSVSLSPSSAQTIKMKGGTKEFTASVLPAGVSQDIEWESSNPAVATVIETQAGTATVTAKASGETTIIATAKGTNIKASVKVNVVLVTGISMVLNSGMSALGYLPGLYMDDDQLKVTVTPSTATQAVTFSSSNNSVATVENDGTITVNGPGTVTFTATATDGTGKSGNLTVNVYHLSKKLSWDDISKGESNYPQPNPTAAATGYCGTGSPWASYEYGWGEPNWCNPYSSGKSGISAAATKRNNFLYKYSYMMDDNSNTCYCTSFDIWANDAGWTLAPAPARQTSPHYIQLNFKNSYKAIAFRFMNPTQDFCRLTEDIYPAIKVNGTTPCFDYYVSGVGGDWNTYQYWFIAKSSDISSIRIQPYAVTGYSTDWLGFNNNEMSGWQQTYGCFGIAEIEIYVAP